MLIIMVLESVGKVATVDACGDASVTVLSQCVLQMLMNNLRKYTSICKCNQKCCVY